MFTRTFASFADEARSLTERANDPSLDNGVLAPWINEEIRRVWAFAAAMRPDEFTKVSGSFFPNGQGQFTIGADGGFDSAEDFMTLRGVDVSRDSGAHWKRVRPYRFTDRGTPWEYGYRLYGRLLQFLPVEGASQNLTRFWYVYAPPEMLSQGSPEPDPPDTIDLPLGADDYVAHGVAARIRMRVEEDPVIHYAAQKAALETMQRWFALNHQGEPEPIRGADEADEEGR